MIGHRQYDAPQLRLDTWNELQVQANWLHEFARTSRPADEAAAAVADHLETLRCLEFYWAFPGGGTVEELAGLFARREHEELARRVRETVRTLVGETYRGGRGTPESRAYFEMLVVDSVSPSEQSEMRAELLETRRDEDEFIYDTVFAPSFEDAVIAVLFNRTIQSCVLRYTYAFETSNRHEIFARYLDMLAFEKPPVEYGLGRSLSLAKMLKALRPELDLYLVTDTPLERVAGHLGRNFRRAFYRLDNFLELHLSVLKGIRARYETPFFDALRRYSQKPAGVFHALPVSRAKSITNSHWIRDMGRFYGTSIFLAETSATSGGLDSLLQPHGPIKRAQDLAARAFGARQTFFVTNGTSTANKIVVQALTSPGDIVLVSHDCHKSHHYALILAGAHPLYLDAYPLPEYSMYGAVPLSEIKRQLLALKRAGKLDRVRMLLLTNCTFDGVTYDPQRVMMEVLAIKPDMIFLWDEAWFAFARFDPMLRRRTAMASADALRETFRSEAYRQSYDEWKADFETLDPDDDATWVGRPLMADPDLARVRVYATHSTHKTLTALRQGSMIHVSDEDYDQKASNAMREALMAHTSTSPNYQIVASLDVGRRQVELEGHELVQKSIGLAMALRERIYEHPLISRYFKVLRPEDMIPEAHRQSGLEYYYDPEHGWAKMESSWRTDEFTLDPTRVTVHIGRTGVDGDTFRHLLMDEHDIQINKTSRNTVLFMTNIGMSRGDVAYLVEVLARIARDLDERLRDESEIDLRLHRQQVSALTDERPPLPNFSRFHDAFRPDPGGTPEGSMREAFFLANDDAACEYMRLDGTIAAAMEAGREVVSASFVTPYPPGFPILVPGQVISPEILAYLKAVDVKEIHGYEPRYGLRVFTEEAVVAEGERNVETSNRRNVETSETERTP